MPWWGLFFALSFLFVVVLALAIIWPDTEAEPEASQRAPVQSSAEDKGGSKTS